MFDAMTAHPTGQLAVASSSLQHQRAGSTPISLHGPPTGFAPHGALKIHLTEAAKLPVSSALAISSLGSLSFKMNVRVALLQIASQQLKQRRNRGGRMTSEYAAMTEANKKFLNFCLAMMAMNIILFLCEA